MTPMTYDEWAAIGLVNGWLGVRANDPTTSKAGAQSVAIRSGSQRTKLLEAYALYGNEMTDETAGILSGLHGKGAGYWKRCSELRRAGYIALTGTTGRSLNGSLQQCSRITAAGRKALAPLTA